MGLVWLLSRRDLGWRRRRLAMAVAGTTVAFALTLLLTGMREGVDLEANLTVDSLGADAFLVSDSVTGPFTSLGQSHVEGITELLRSLRSPDRVMLVATHDPRLVPLTSDTMDLGPRIGATGS